VDHYEPTNSLDSNRCRVLLDSGGFGWHYLQRRRISGGRSIGVYFIVVHQSAEQGREADVARGGTDRPTRT